MIENVKLEGDINLNSKNDYAGGIAPECENTTFRNIKITGKVNISGKFGVGGLVGRLYNCKISKCCVDSPEGLVKGNNTVGGLLGMPNLAEIDTSYAYINVEGNHDVGGLLGRFYGPSLTNCYSDCKITVNDSNNNNYYIGGLVGYTYSENGTINNCYASGTINLNCSLAKSVGTIIGFYSKLSSINNSFSTVNIKVTDTYSYNNSNNDNFNPDVAGTSLWYKFDYDLYDGEYVFDSNGTNYCNSGYKNTLEWNTAYWFNLSDGSFPKLIGLPNR